MTEERRQADDIRRPPPEGVESSGKATLTQETGPEVPVALTAGGLLRRARQARGLHIAVLAASIKVPQRKLESLEADRYEDLPDMTFTRALAQTVCRSLKVDAEPVLALMPQAANQGLAHVRQGLNTPFRERPGRIAPTDWSVLSRPAVWLPALLLLAALLVYLLPQQWIMAARFGTDAAPAARVQAPAAAAVFPPASAVAAAAAEPAPVFPLEPAASAGEAVVEAALSGVLQLRVAGESWVEVLDASGAPLLQRMLHPGEAVGLDGALPMRVKIGNAAVTSLSFRGQPVELAPRDNVAKLELK